MNGSHGGRYGFGIGFGGGRRPRAVGLFDGCGGMDLGFEQAGVEIVAANDAWEPAVQTHRANFPHATMVHGDITDPAVKARIVEACGGRCDIVIGGPPCAAFSTSGRRDPNDPRGLLFEHYIDMVARLRPAVVVMENVVGILTPRKGEGVAAVASVKTGLERLGYRVDPGVLNAADFGVPQRRRRVIIIAAQPGVPIAFPAPTHSKRPDPSSGLLPWVTIREAIGDFEDAPEDPGSWHVFTRHSARFLERIRRTSLGGSCGGLFRDGYKRIPPGLPSTTIKTVCWPIHYARDRALTPREAARIQGFPDDFRFVGTKGDVARMIGNAVPPPLARAIGLAVLGMLRAPGRSRGGDDPVTPCTPPSSRPPVTDHRTP